ncbi:type VI secretion system baseplate subunit TssF [Paraburkholderia megapolitana]|uniref:type VI secretion system baseplate subunit TssF n=1 Tax=Paraburkholderia megapolitana TaxID=420953 RepID=UPI0038B9C91F
MEELLPFYERELALLRRYARDFAGRNPKIAARIALSGERSDDPHVERMVESFALLSARIDTRIEDEYPEFTEALLEMLYPQYLRAIPSCSIAQFAADPRASQLTEAVTVARGAMLEARNGECRFSTVYDVTVLTLRLTQARYSVTAIAPSSARLPAATTGLISITFEPPIESGEFTPASRAETLRVHLGGEQPFVSALADTLLMRTTAAFVEADNRGVWKPLGRVPLEAVGLAEHDVLLDAPAGASGALRLLFEFFAFPDKFQFVDIALAQLMRAAGPCRKLTLHLAVTGTPTDSPVARWLEMLNASHLKLFCTPIVNLFKREAQPIRVASATVSYPVIPQTLRVSNTEIHSIDSVHVTEQKPTGKTVTVIPPYRSLQHIEYANPLGLYWISHRDRWVARQRPGYETEIALVRMDGTPASFATQLGIELTCTNRDLPAGMSFGAPGGDLLNEDASFACIISMLRSPSVTARLPRRNQALWRLVAQLTPNLFSFGLAGLKALLHQHVGAGAPSVARVIDGIVGLDYRACMKWMPIKPLPTFVRGIEVRLTLDEAAFVGVSLATFVSVMDQLFAPYAHQNSFVQLVVISSATDTEIARCEARQGMTAVL